MKSLLILLPLIGCLTAGAQSNWTTTDHARGTVGIAIVPWSDFDSLRKRTDVLEKRVDFLTRQLVETRRSLDSLIGEVRQHSQQLHVYLFSMCEALDNGSIKDFNARFKDLLKFEYGDSVKPRYRLTTQ